MQSPSLGTVCIELGVEERLEHGLVGRLALVHARQLMRAAIEADARPIASGGPA